MYPCRSQRRERGDSVEWPLDREALFAPDRLRTTSRTGRTAAGTSRVRRRGDSFFDVPASLPFSPSYPHCSRPRELTEELVERLLNATENRRSIGVRRRRLSR